MSFYDTQRETIIEELHQAAPGWYECSACGLDLSDDRDDIAALLDHVLFDHAMRADIIEVHRAVAVGHMTLGRRLDLAAQTEYEQRWRDSFNELAP